MPSKSVDCSPVRAALLFGSLSLGLLVPGLAVRAQSTPAVPAVDRQVKVGAGLYEIVVSEPTNSIWVASTGAGQQRVIELDATTLAEKRSISTADAPAFGLGINTKTQMLYTSNTRAGTVSAIDLKKGAVVATIGVASDPSAHGYRVLVDDVANKVYVSIVATPSKIWIIDGATNTLEHVIEGVGARVTGLALDRAGNRLFGASLASNEIVEINLATRTVARQYPSGGERPTQMAYDPATRRLFVTQQGTSNVVALDTTTGTVIKAIDTAQQALGIGFDAARNLLYVANRGGGKVTVINAETYAVVAQIEAGTMPNTVAIDSRDGTVFVTNKARPAGRGRAAGVAPAPPDEGGDTVTRITVRR